MSTNIFRKSDKSLQRVAGLPALESLWEYFKTKFPLYFGNPANLPNPNKDMVGNIAQINTDLTEKPTIWKSADNKVWCWKEADGKITVQIWYYAPTYGGQTIATIPSEYIASSLGIDMSIPLASAQSGSVGLSGVGIIRSNGRIDYFGSTNTSGTYTLGFCGQVSYYK